MKLLEFLSFSIDFCSYQNVPLSNNSSFYHSCNKILDRKFVLILVSIICSHFHSYSFSLFFLLILKHLDSGISKQQRIKMFWKQIYLRCNHIVWRCLLERVTKVLFRNYCILLHCKSIQHFFYWDKLKIIHQTTEKTFFLFFVVFFLFRVFGSQGLVFAILGYRNLNFEVPISMSIL